MTFSHPWKGWLRELVEVRGKEDQLGLYAAVLTGVRRSLDDWIAAERLEEYRVLARRLGLVVAPDCVFRPLADPAPTGLELAPTTRASGAPFPEGLDGTRGASVHLFVARRGDLAAEARAAGWYPVEIGGRIVHKPLIDHRRLGLAFGYPLCCVDFFLHHNDWPRQNTLAEAARRPTALSWQANSLPKKSPFMLLFHMPCTFDCEATREQARVTLEALREVDSAFAERIESFLRGLFLSISERAVFRLQGAREFGDDRVRYRSALDLRAAGSVQESWEERYHELLAAGDEVRVEEGDVHVLRQGRLVASLGCRCDRGVAEVPLLLDFR